MGSERHIDRGSGRKCGSLHTHRAALQQCPGTRSFVHCTLVSHDVVARSRHVLYRCDVPCSSDLVSILRTNDHVRSRYHTFAFSNPTIQDLETWRIQKAHPASRSQDHQHLNGQIQINQKIRAMNPGQDQRLDAAEGRTNDKKVKDRVRLRLAKLKHSQWQPSRSRKSLRKKR